MDLIIEIASRAGRAQHEAVSFKHGVIRLGRAYDNDCILSEPHVSEHHGEIRRDQEGRWWYQDLGSLNGSFDARGQRLNSPTEVCSGDELLLGRLRLRFLAPSHAVAPTQQLGRWHHLFGLLQHPALLLAQILVAGGLFMLDQSFTEFDPPRWGKQLADLFWFVGLLLVWAGFWSLLGKILRHEARFAAQLVVASGLMFFGVLSDWLSQWLNFNTTDPLLGLGLDALLGALLIGSMASISLQLAAHSQHWHLRLGAHLAGWVLVAFLSVQPFQRQLDFSPHPQYVAELAPPALRVHPAVSTEQFLQDAREALAPAERPGEVSGTVR